jgi:hypothetical protein
MYLGEILPISTQVAKLGPTIGGEKKLWVDVIIRFPKFFIQRLQSQMHKMKLQVLAKPFL